MSVSAVTIDAFQGGLDLVSSLNAIQQGSCPSAMNMRIAEYGGVEKILGYSSFATLSEAGSDMFEYKKRDGTYDRLIVSSATKVHSIDSTGVVSEINTGRTSEERTSFASYDDVLYFLGPQNVLKSWDGATLTSHATGANTGPNKGVILGVWQNRMFVAKATSGVLGTRIEWSEPGILTGVGSWPAANFVELGGPGSTERIIGAVVTPDGLIVFTTASTYLLFNSSTGANRVLDPEFGCESHRSLSYIDGMTMGVCRDGVFAVQGAQPLSIVSRKVDPLFIVEDPDTSTAAGVRWRNSYLMSYDRGSTFLTLDIVPSLGMPVMANEYPAFCWQAMDFSGPDLYFVDRNDRTQVRLAFSSGSFGSAPIRAHYELPAQALSTDEQLSRLRRVRVLGRGIVSVGARSNYDGFDSHSGTAAMPSTGGTGLFDTSLWDAATWVGYTLGEAFATIPCRGRRIGLRIEEFSSNVMPSRDHLGFSVGPDIGAAAIYQIEMQFNTLARRR